MVTPRLEAQLQAILNELPAGHDFDIYTISTAAASIPSLTPRQRLSTVHTTYTTELRRLILLIQKDNKPLSVSAATTQQLETGAASDASSGSGGGGSSSSTTTTITTTTSNDPSLPTRRDGALLTRFVCGLSVREFVTVTTYRDTATAGRYSEPRTETCTHVYLEKIDSTGCATLSDPSIISPMRALVVGYVAFAAQLYHGVLQSMRVYTFARSQPEYLFARSSENRNKRQLDDLQLVRWWKRTLDAAASYIATRLPDASIQGYAFSPGADRSEAFWFRESAELPAALKPESSSVSPAGRSTWHWGLGYPLEARAQDVIPHYPDDAMTRLLEKRESADWTVSQVQEMIAISEECGAGRRTAFFALDVPTCPPQCFLRSTSAPSSTIGSPIADAFNTTTTTTTAIAAVSSAPYSYGMPFTIPNTTPGAYAVPPPTTPLRLLSVHEYEQVELALFNLSMDFSSSASASVSTTKFLNWLSRRLPEIRPLHFTTAGTPASHGQASSSLSSSSSIATLSGHKRPPTEAAPAAAVNTLSGNLVRKKQKVKP
ncbi:hypothetical protein EV182_001584 [Spiromyces aspiralis]|uniref:Uncharacterized protein n=1 Tax=Spiromyces aspiralis TaxID=68401 RepID=A0ACC1HG03_9FUNG|nr:hypothetical protein EV182_001584 [Spiromyces aspiralis]